MKTKLLSLFSALILGSAAPAQVPCSSTQDFNWSNPLVDIWEFQDVWKRCVLVENPHPYPIQVCKAAMRFKHNLGLLPGLPEPSVFYSWVTAQPLGQAYVPFLPLGSITQQMTIPYNVTMTQRGTFVTPLVLQPGEKVYLVANFYVPPLTVGGDWISSTLTHSPNHTHSWYWKNGQWNQSLANGYHYQLTYRPYQAAGMSSTGTGCGAPYAPSLTVQAPVIGSSSTMHVSDMQSGVLAFHMVGWSNPNVPLDALGAPGCRARSSADVFYPGITTPGGDHVHAIAFPNDVSLIGASYYVQGASLDVGANQLGINFSNGLRATVGSY